MRKVSAPSQISTVKTSTKQGLSPTALTTLARGLLGRALGFRDCPAAVLDALAALCQLSALSRGATLLRRGEAVSHCWLVIDGVIEISVLHGDGHRHLVGLAIPGQFTALKTLADGLAEPHDLIVREDAVVMAFDVHLLSALRPREPSASQA